MAPSNESLQDGKIIISRDKFYSVISANVLLTVANMENSNLISDMELGMSCLDRCNCLAQTARTYLLFVQQGKTMSFLSPKYLGMSTALEKLIGKTMLFSFKKHDHNICLLLLKSSYFFWLMMWTSTKHMERP